MLVVRYCIENNWPYNFGDGINPLVYKYFTKKEIIIKCCFDEFNNENNNDSVLGFGSIIQFSSKFDIVFGAGLLDLNRAMQSKPKQIISVRGPLTRKFLLESGIECPDVYGDPALLLPFMYYPKVIKKYKLGIIPHYLDKKQFNYDSSVLILNIESSHKHEQFINDILSCECIISSSLHGIIVGDAYNVPSYLCKLGRLDVNNVKFHDYFQSVNREFYLIKLHNDINEMIKQMKPYKCNINMFQLIELFPFIDETVKNNCMEKIDGGFLDYLM